MVSPNPCCITDPPNYEGGFEREDIVELLDLMDLNMIASANFFAPMAMKNRYLSELSNHLLNYLCATDSAITRHFIKVVFLSDVRAKLAKLTGPALVMQCADDSVAPVSVGGYGRHFSVARSSL